MKTRRPRSRRRTRSGRSLSVTSVFASIIGVLAVASFAGVRAQVAPTDADLITASAGRTVRLGRIGGGVPVSEVPLEVYVARVLAGEAEPRAADASNQALAIAIRTFVLANPDRHPRDDFDFCDSTHCQVPRAATETTRRAALATAGQILAYEGKPAELFYSASCGGRSESAASIGLTPLPYLRSTPDDVHNEDVAWTTTFTLRQLQDALRRAGVNGDRLRDVRIDARNESGRVDRLRIVGLQPEVINGYEFRLAVGALELRSTAFTLERRGEAIQFTGRGFGHGVGMCVVGAGRRAVRGESVAAILGHYFPGLELTRINASPGLPPAVDPATTSRAVPASPARAGITVRVPQLSPVSAADVERIAETAHASLTRVLGTSRAPVTVQLHETLESFRAATGRPWWVSTVSSGTTIDLVPAVLLAQREGIEAAIRTAMADLFVSDTLAGRPAWVRVGAARYFGRDVPPAPPAASVRLRCPADAELTLALSAPAQRDAEARAEACFAREFAKTQDWRAVR